MATRLGNYKKLIASAHAATATTRPAVGTTGGGPPDGATAIGTYTQDLQTVGCTITRTYISGNFVNPSPGVYDFAYRQGGPDLWYADAIAAGQGIIMQPLFSPTHWYQGSPTHTTRAYTDWPLYDATPGSDWLYWVNSCAAFAARCAQQYPLAILEDGNEMNVNGIYASYNFVLSAAVPPQAYAARFMAVTAAVKAVNPSQKVIIGGLLRMDSALTGLSGIAFLQQLQPFFAAQSFVPDGVSIHPYMLGAATSDPTIDKGPNAIGVTSWQSVGRCLNALDALGYHLPVYVTETGFRASQSNAQGAFNCNSETTKKIWNRYEHDSAYFQYSKPARGNGSKAWVEAMLYYRAQEYPSPTSPTYAAAFPGDPATGPHPLNAWGLSLQDYIAKQNTRYGPPKLESVLLTGVPSTAVIGQAPIPISAAGGNIEAVPALVSSDPTVAAVATPPTGSATTTVSFPGSGTVTITARSTNAAGLSISAAQTCVVAPQIPNASVVSPGAGWKVATSNSGTLQFTVVVTDQIGNVIAGATGVWSSSDPTNAPITAGGLLSAVGLSASVVVTFTPTGGTGGSAGTSTGDVVLNPVLNITTPATTLINVGALDIAVTDGAGAVTGCTLIISDATKATAVGQTLVGLGTSGTYTVVARKSGYTDSTPITMTCSGGGYFDDKDAYGFTNGVGVASYADPGGTTWAQSTSSLRPVANTNDLNGHASLAFDGVDDYLRAGAAVPSLNGAGTTYLALVYPTNVAPSANGQLLDNRDTTNDQGFVFGLATTGKLILSYYNTVGPIVQLFDGPVLTVNAWQRAGFRLNQGAQDRMLNGSIVGTSGTSATYRNQTTAPGRAVQGGSIFLAAGNNFPGHVAAAITVDHAATTAEWQQMDRWLSLYASIVGPGSGTFPVAGDTILTDQSPGGAQDIQAATMSTVAASRSLWGDGIADPGFYKPTRVTNNADGAGTHAFVTDFYAFTTPTVTSLTNAGATTIPITDPQLFVDQFGLPQRVVLGFGTASAEERTITAWNGTNATISVATSNTHPANDPVAVGNESQTGIIQTYLTTTGVTPHHVIARRRVWRGRSAYEVSQSVGRGSANAFQTYNRHVTGGDSSGHGISIATGGNAGRKHCLFLREALLERTDHLAQGSGSGFNNYESHEGGVNRSTGGNTTFGSNSTGALDVDLFTGQWIDEIYELQAESTLNALDGVVRFAIDYNDGNGEQDLYKNTSAQTGPEDIDSIQFNSIFNTPFLDCTEYTTKYQIWCPQAQFSQTWAPAYVSTAPTFVSHVAGAVTLSVAIPASGVDAIQFWKSTDPNGGTYQYGPWATLGAPVTIVGGDLGTTKQYAVTVPSGQTTHVAYSFGKSGHFNCGSLAYAETNP